MYRAVLDTCVLVPGLQRDFLLQLAAEGAYAPVWGSGILVELDYVLERLHAKRGNLDTSSSRQRLLSRMREAFPGAEVQAPKGRAYGYDIADSDDAHVVHAALIGKADAIVTQDTRAGFEDSDVLSSAGVKILTPRDFAADAVAAHPATGNRAIDALVLRMTTPATTRERLIEEIRVRYRMEEVASLLAQGRGPRDSLR